MRRRELVLVEDRYAGQLSDAVGSRDDLRVWTVAGAGDGAASLAVRAPFRQNASCLATRLFHKLDPKFCL